MDTEQTTLTPEPPEEVAVEESTPRRKEWMSPLVIRWEDDRGHTKTTRVEANRIYIPKCERKQCGKNLGGAHFHIGTILDEEKPNAFVTFDKLGAKAVQRTELWGAFVALLDLIQGRDGFGNPTRRWCTRCADRLHSASACDCPCHRAMRYYVAVTEPGEKVFRAA